MKWLSESDKPMAVAVLLFLVAGAVCQDCTTWYENTKHSPAAFRNVKTYGAKGDGVTDDTAAIQAALTQGRNPNPSTHDPTVVYLPAGTYLVHDTLPLYFYTHLIGNFKCRPTIVLAPNSPGFNGRKYVLEATFGDSEHVSNFYHQIHNVDVTISDGNPGAVGIHWSVAQATSLRNMTINVGSGDMGYFNENGGGGFIGDVTILGGNTGMMIGGQQWTIRGLTVSGSRNVAVDIIWNWVFTFLDLEISNTPVGVQLKGTAAGTASLLDSTFTNVYYCVDTDFPLPLEGVLLDRVTAVNATYITAALQGNPGGTVFVPSWRQGNAFANGQKVPSPAGPLPVTRPDVPIPSIPLPTFGNGQGGGVLNAYDAGAKGDGVTDDTAALQGAIDQSDEVFLPSGTYLISSPLKLRSTTSLIGEALSILSAKAGSPAFSDPNNPQPMLLTPSDPNASVHLAGLLLSVQGDVPGCSLLEWGVGPASTIHDVHYRIEYTTWGLLHMTGQGGGYIENSWLWTVDHDIDTGETITVQNPRSFLCESSGPTWMVGTASEHSYMYQYNFTGASNVTMLLTQTETPYWQSPPSAWAMTIHNSKNIYLYGAGFYNWFQGTQQTLFEVVASTNVNLYAVSVNFPQSSSNPGVDYILTGDRTIATNSSMDWFCGYFMAEVPF